MPESALVFDDVTLAYSAATPAVTGLRLRVEPGQALALIGPNGAGKSTILRGILGLVSVTAGRLQVLGTDAPAARLRIGYMPQTDTIDPEFPVSVRQVVTMGLYRRIGWLRWPSRADRDSVDRALDLVGLSRHANIRFGQLSGGQRQRAIFARSIVSQPELLLLDEPFNGLDADSRAGLIETINQLKSDGVAVVMSTHDISLAQQAADLVLLVNHRQIAFGPREETLTLDLIAEAHPAAAVEVDQHSLHVPDHEGH